MTQTDTPTHHTQTPPKQWLLASNNQGKLAEFQALFAQAGIDILPQAALGVKDAIEDGHSFVENAIIKARHASKISGLPAIADDSGLVTPVLGNAPGIYSARYAGEHGDDAANNQKLLSELKTHHDAGALVDAYFVCVLVQVNHADDPLPVIAQGLWHGQIVPEMRGTGGFGYDPIFYVPELAKTSAELSQAQKNAISHRARALKALMQALKAQRRLI